MELEEEKTMRSLVPFFHESNKQLEPSKRTGVPKSSLGSKIRHSVPTSQRTHRSTDHSSTDLSKSSVSRRLSPPQSTELRKRSMTGQEGVKRRKTDSSEGLQTPPRRSKPPLTIHNYSRVEKERSFDAYKRDKPILQSLPSLDDLQLPKLPSMSGTKVTNATAEETNKHTQDVESKKGMHKHVGELTIIQNRGLRMSVKSSPENKSQRSICYSRSRMDVTVKESVLIVSVLVGIMENCVPLAAAVTKADVSTMDMNKYLKVNWMKL